MELLEPFLESAALGSNSCNSIFFTSTPFTRIDQIYLAGGCAMLSGLVDIVAERTKLSTSVISPFKGMELGSAVNERPCAAMHLPIWWRAVLRCGGLTNDKD